MYLMMEIPDYIPNSVRIKTVIRKIRGDVRLLVFDSGSSLTEKASPFDMLIQIIEGRAEIRVNRVCSVLETGQVIIIPAYARKTINAPVRFKMLSTVIKNGYDH